MPAFAQPLHADLLYNDLTLSTLQYACALLGHICVLKVYSCVCEMCDMQAAKLEELRAQAAEAAAAAAPAEGEEGGEPAAPAEPTLDEPAVDVEAEVAKAVEAVERPTPKEISDGDLLSAMIDKAVVTKDAIIQALAIHALGDQSYAKSPLFAPVPQ